MRKASIPVLISSLMALVSFASAQESVTPLDLVEHFKDVCTPIMQNFVSAVGNFENSGWQLQKSQTESKSFFSGQLFSPDGNYTFDIQSYNFSRGTFTQCGAFAYSNLLIADLEQIKSSFARTEGSIVHFAEDGFSALWMLPEENDFTSLNVISQNKKARIIMMRTTYLASAN
jgi:hypothetical protein